MEGSLVKEYNIYTHIQGTRKNTELHRLTGVLRCYAIFPVQYCDSGSGRLLKLTKTSRYYHIVNQGKRSMKTLFKCPYMKQIGVISSNDYR